MANAFRQGPIPISVPEPEALDPAIVHIEDPEGATKFDATSDTLRTELPDGAVIIHFGNPKPKPKIAKGDEFYRNLAEEMPESELSALAYELCLGIEADIQSVAERNADLATGIKMLGVKLEEPTQMEASSGSAPTDGMSRVYDPSMHDAILRFQATASGELLPSEGPVKVENTGVQGEPDDAGAAALENAMNIYFTKTAPEYYPDTKRLLYDTGFSGSGFKKCYPCPIRQRPVSESIASKHLVVANAARDLKSCGRKTHLVEMEPATFLRMQHIGVYRDIYLPEPTGGTVNPVDRATNEALGVKPDAMNQKDRYRYLYETYVKTDVSGFEDKDKKGELTGLPLPFRITIDVESKEILEIRRNWDKDDPMKTETRVFVKYPYVEALGFYGIGLFHIMGNMTRAITAGLRLSLDGGMLSNFPAFLIDKMATRQLTNDFRLPAGGSAIIDVPSGRSIKDLVMAVPYKDVSAAFMALLGEMRQIAQKIGGTAETSIGEGKQDAPVGTTLALLEQATKVTDAVHKGLHAAQAEEFQIMKELFEDDPEALWRHSPKESENWDKDAIKAALMRCDLVPRADPNTPSQMHRVAKVQALVQLAGQSPGQFDLKEIAGLAVRTLGFSNADKYLAKTPPGGAPPDPKDQAAADKAAAAKLSAQADVQDSQTKAAELQFKSQTFGQQMQNDKEERDEDLANTRMKEETERIIHQGSQQVDQQKLAAEQQSQASAQQHERTMHAIDTQADLTKTAAGRGADVAAQLREHAHEKQLEALKPKPVGGGS